MKHLLISAALIALTAPAFAQSAPQAPDPQIQVYRQLLDNANAQLAAAVAQAQTQIASLQKALAEKNAPKVAPNPAEPKPQKKP